MPSRRISGGETGGAAARACPCISTWRRRRKPKTPTCSRPAFNVISGSHAGNKLAFQNFIIPTGAPSFNEGLRIGTECYHTLAKIIKNKFGDAWLIGDEGASRRPAMPGKA